LLLLLVLFFCRCVPFWVPILAGFHLGIFLMLFVCCVVGKKGTSPFFSFSFPITVSLLGCLFHRGFSSFLMLVLFMFVVVNYAPPCPFWVPIFAGLHWGIFSYICYPLGACFSQVLTDLFYYFC
jgi:hypothetical protein